MSNNSSTGGYLVGTPPTLPGQLTFNQFLQTVFAGVSGLPGEFIRPKWQLNPPKQPDAYTNWIAIGLTRNKADTFAYVGTSTGQQATGYVRFLRTPLPGDTITVNGLVITFVSGTPTGNQVPIGLCPDDTAFNLNTFLTASTSGLLTVATYAVLLNTVTITFTAEGTAGNAFTLANSNPAIPGLFLSGPTLTGGGTSDNYFQRMEELDVQASFIGPDALEMSSYVRDGFQIPQNLEALRSANMGFVACSEAMHVPDLLNERWVNRYEMTFVFRREIQRTYPTLSLLSANVTITAQLEVGTKTVNVVVDNE